MIRKSALGAAIAAVPPGTAGTALDVNEAYISPQTGAVDLSFAIPAATALDIAEELRTSGRARPAFTGLTPATVTADIARDFDLPVTSRVLVSQVTAAGPANQAGITAGTVITELAGQPTPSVEAFLTALRRFDPRQRVPVTFFAPGRQSPQTGTITLAERP